jgi:hypothetical protein
VPAASPPEQHTGCNAGFASGTPFANANHTQHQQQAAVTQPAESQQQPAAALAGDAACVNPAGASNTVTNISMHWLLRQIPPGWNLEHIVTGGSEMYGVLCLQCPAADQQQQQQQQGRQLCPAWMAAVWDGEAWHIVGMYGCEQQARDVCVCAEPGSCRPCCSSWQ